MWKIGHFDRHLHPSLQERRREKLRLLEKLAGWFQISGFHGNGLWIYVCLHSGIGKPRCALGSGLTNLEVLKSTLWKRPQGYKSPFKRQKVKMQASWNKKPRHEQVSNLTFWQEMKAVNWCEKFIADREWNTAGERSSDCGAREIRKGALSCGERSLSTRGGKLEELNFVKMKLEKWTRHRRDEQSLQKGAVGKQEAKQRGVYPLSCFLYNNIESVLWANTWWR